MKNGSQISYHSRFPQISSRIPRELKEVLLQRQIEKGVSLSEVIEDAIRNGVNAPINPSGAASNNDHGQHLDNPGGAAIIDNESTLYDRGFSDGFKNGSNHTKKDIKNKFGRDSQKINGAINDLFKQQIKNNKDECAECGGTFLNEKFALCPYCGIEFANADNSDGRDGSIMPDFSDIHKRIPIISDLFGFSDEDDDDNAKKINFVGGDKSIDQSKNSGDRYQCCACDFTQGSPFENCPKCGASNSWD